MDNVVFTPPWSVPPAIEAPVVFLAGPIQGAENWQETAIEYLRNRPEELMIASPRRSVYDITSKTHYEEQVEWETKWLDVASKQGVILFWCPKEFEHSCARAYAQTTRVEMGEWVLGDKKCRLAIGFEEGYTGSRYVTHRLKTSEKAELRDLKLSSNLKDTCDEAIRQLPVLNTPVSKLDHFARKYLRPADEIKVSSYGVAESFIGYILKRLDPVSYVVYRDVVSIELAKYPTQTDQTDTLRHFDRINIRNTVTLKEVSVRISTSFGNPSRATGILPGGTFNFTGKEDAYVREDQKDLVFRRAFNSIKEQLDEKVS